MWRSGWALVPSKDVQLVVAGNPDEDVECWDYPWVGFADGEIEGNDLNTLWSLVCQSTASKPMWGEILRDAPHACEKVALVRPAVIETFAALSAVRIQQLAVEWQCARSVSGSVAWWKVEDLIDAIQQLKFLARQQLKLRPGWELLMIWYC